jgi:hypothetical protein
MVALLLTTDRRSRTKPAGTTKMMNTSTSKFEPTRTSDTPAPQKEEEPTIKVIIIIRIFKTKPPPRHPPE